jgi:hypothetical protein
MPRGEVERRMSGSSESGQTPKILKPSKNVEAKMRPITRPHFADAGTN